jgi:hypothetical protein
MQKQLPGHTPCWTEQQHRCIRLQRVTRYCSLVVDGELARVLDKLSELICTLHFLIVLARTLSTSYKRIVWADRS